MKKFNILNRYIIKIIIPNFLIGLVIFGIINLIQFLYELISLGIEKNIPFDKILKLLFYLLPFLMSFTVPVAILVGVLLTIGDLSANSEITAMRTNGLRMSDIFKPVIFFGLAVVVLYILFFQFVLPWGNKNYVMTKYEVVRKHPIIEITKNKKFRQEHLEIRIGKADSSNNSFKDIRIVDFNQNLLFISDEGFFLDKDEKANVFPLILKNVYTLPYVFRPKTDNKFQHHFYEELKVNVKDFDIKKIMPKGSELEGIIELMQRIKKLKRQKIANIIRTYHKIIKKGVELKQSSIRLKELQTNPAEFQKEQNRKKRIANQLRSFKKRYERVKDKTKPRSETYVLHRKFSYATSALLMAILAAPLGLIKRRKGKEIAFGLAFIGYLVYNALIISGNVGTKEKIVSPEFAAWFPNIIILGLIILTVRWKLKKH